MTCVGRGVTFLLLGAGIVVAGTGCRQLFGIDDTDVAAADAPVAGDDANGARDAAPIDGAPDAAPPDAFVCPTGYVQLGGLPHRYRQLPQAMPWTQGVNLCAAQLPGHTHMVVLDDEQERIALLPFTPDLWIGVTDAVDEGQWVTVLGAPATFLPWASGQPAAGTEQNCGELESDGLHDNTCGNDRTIVCECE